MNPLAKAIAIAANAHLAHAPDKGGAPYILHPLRLMLRMDSDTARMVAVLHDVVEDHAHEGYTFDFLAAEGIPGEVIAALRCVTKTAAEERDSEGKYMDFVRRAATDPIARQVKIADLEDNMNLLRIAAELSDRDLARLKRYHAAWRLLTDDAARQQENRP